MDKILSDLQTSDSFNIITFSDIVNIWKAEGSIQATVQNIHNAKNYVSRMEANGCKCYSLFPSICPCSHFCSILFQIISSPRSTVSVI